MHTEINSMFWTFGRIAFQFNAPKNQSSVQTFWTFDDI